MNKLFLFILSIFFLMSNLPQLKAAEISEIVMHVQVLKVDWVNGNETLSISSGTKPIFGPILYKNSGNGTENFMVSIDSASLNGFKVVEQPPLGDEVRVHALWHTQTIPPTMEEFQDNDILILNGKISSNTVFFNDLEEHDKNGVKGSQINSGEQRSLYLWVEVPKESSKATNLRLIVEAVSGE